jgi:Tfp pilus assembly protein PilF
MSTTKPQPEIAAGYAALAGAYHSAGEHVDAETWWRRALAGDDSMVGCHVGLARTLAELGRLDEAEGHLRRALALDPLCDEAARIYAEICRWQGRLSEAARLFLSALVRGAAGAVHLGYAELTWALGAVEDAEKHYRRALHHADVSAEACADLGVLLVTHSRPAEAEPHLRRAADQLPCPETLTNHANVLVELGRDAEADARYREALALDPACAEALWGLAELEAGQGHTTSAADLRRRAVDLRPGIAGRCR